MSLLEKLAALFVGQEILVPVVVPTGLILLLVLGPIPNGTYAKNRKSILYWWTILPIYDQTMLDLVLRFRISLVVDSHFHIYARLVNKIKRSHFFSCLAKNNHACKI